MAIRSFIPLVKSYTTPPSPTWCGNASRHELLQRQGLVSVTRYACEKLRCLGLLANETNPRSPLSKRACASVMR
jgi:hypothetical protein